MIIRARIAVVTDVEPIMAEGDVELKDGARVKKFFDVADKALGFAKEKHVKKIMKSKLAPTVLLNGDRLDLPQGMKHTLKDGDEITVLSPMMGG